MKRFERALLSLAVLVPVLACAGAAAEPVAVRTAALAEIAVYPLREAPATAVSLNETRIAAQIASRIEDLPVRVGDVVDKGDALVQLDCTDYVLARREAEAVIAALDARLELAGRRLARTQKLTLNQTVAEELLDERSAELATLRAERGGAEAVLERARVDESRCRVASPFRAVVTERIASVGAFADRGTQLVHLVDLDALEVSAQVSAGDVDQVRQARELWFEFDGRRYPVAVRTVVGAVDTETRNQDVRLLFTADPALPGAAGKLYWRDPRPHLPGSLLVRRGDQLGAFTTGTGVARFIPIPQAQAGRASAVDLPMNTPLVVEGQFAVEDGEAVNIVP